MNVAVCINHVPDTATKIVIDASGTSIESAGVSYILNPYDEYAIEEALKLKDKTGAIIYVLLVGNDAAKETIRKALALGADEGILLRHEDYLDSYSVSNILAAKIKDLGCTVVFMGKQSVDYDNSIVGQMTAEFLDFNCISVCVSFAIEGDTVTAEREIEGGREVVQTQLPVVITAQKGLNEPRYASLKGIMAAKKKTITEIEIGAVDTKVKLSSLKKTAPKNPGRILGSGIEAAKELVVLLRDEAKVI